MFRIFQYHFWVRVSIGMHPMFLCLIVLINFNGYGAIQVTSIEELQKIGNDPNYPLNEEYELTRDIDASDTKNWNGGKGFSPIGNSSNPFVGKFNGKSHVIQNLYINRPEQDDVGLFGYIGPGGEVYDLGLEDVNISGHNSVGAISGENDGNDDKEVLIKNCYSTGSIPKGIKYVGGLVGYNDKATVLTCYSDCEVTGAIYIGGLVGYNGNGGKVTFCFARGNIVGIEEVGGLIGHASLCEIDNCFSEGSVTGTIWEDPEIVDVVEESKNKIGGLIGTLYSASLKYSCAQSKTGVDGHDKVGGLIGYCNGSIVEDCFSKGMVKGNDDVGGLVGLLDYENYNFIRNYSTASVSGHSNVGGLIGRLYFAGIGLCYATGSVSGGFYVGGLVGYYCGLIHRCYATGSVSGTKYCGGLAGAIGNGLVEVFSVGHVSGSGNTIGGLAGDYLYPGVSNGIIFWDVDTSGQAPREKVGESEPGLPEIGIGKTTDEMKSQETYSGWDFTNTWGIIEDESYPYFLWQKIPLIEVPDVIGKNMIDAENKIKEVGLQIGAVLETCSDEVPTGMVVVQTPRAGFLVHSDVAVNLMISKGPCTVSVPDVVGKTQDEAQSIIQGVELTVGTVTEQCSNTMPVGKVISQDPAQGAVVVPGSEVKLVISTGDCPPIQLYSIEDIQKIGETGYPLNGKYELAKDIDANATSTWDYGAGFSPRGTELEPFIGKFDGKGHIIRNLYINRSGQNCVGLFGNIGENGLVQNVGLEDANISGDNYVGGLAGKNLGEIIESYVQGIISGKNNVGGIIGDNGGTISDCYSVGVVSGDWEYIGGLVGWNSGEVIDSYSVSKVLGDNNTGGLMGYNDGPIYNSYWDINASGLSNSAGGEGKTTEEMIQQSTYSGWDFINKWGIKDKESYPYLLWQGKPLIFPTEGEGTAEGMVEGIKEGTQEGVEEGVTEGVAEGIIEGTTEGTTEGIGEGTTEGEDVRYSQCPLHLRPRRPKGIEDLTNMLLDFLFLGMVLLSFSGFSKKK